MTPSGEPSALGLRAALPRCDIETGIAGCDAVDGLLGPVRRTGGRTQRGGVGAGSPVPRGLPIGVKMTETSGCRLPLQVRITRLSRRCPVGNGLEATQDLEPHGADLNGEHPIARIQNGDATLECLFALLSGAQDRD
jgi:hypothetical protein